MDNLSITREYNKGDFVIYTNSKNEKYRAVVESVGESNYTLTVSTSKKRTVGMTTITVLAEPSELEPMVLTIAAKLQANRLVSVG